MTDDQHEQLKQTYVETWRRAFTELLAAPQFADELHWFWKEDMDDSHMGFFSSAGNGPIAYFANLILNLVPAESLCGWSGFQMVLAAKEIQVAIQGGQDEFACSAPDFDWNKAEQRLDEYLKRFGTTTAELRKHIDPDLFYYRRNPRWLMKNKQEKEGSL